MPIESATYLHQLDAANPTIADPVAEWDDHMRLAKQVLKATFPNIAGAVTATHADLNQTTGVAGRVTALEGNRARVDVANTFAGVQTFSGVINAGVVQQQGAPLVPSGSIIAWYGLISAIPSGWLLCNGTNGTPNLIDQYIIGAGTLAVGAAVGTSTQTATTTANGSHNHTGAVEPNGSHTHTGTAVAVAGHAHGGNTQGTILTEAQIPAHTHSLTLTGRSGNGAAASPSPGWGTDAVSDGPYTATTSSTGGNSGHDHGIYTDGGHGHTLSVDFVGTHQHTVPTEGAHTHTTTFDNRPASRALVWIMKS